MPGHRINTWEAQHHQWVHKQRTEYGFQPQGKGEITDLYAPEWVILPEVQETQDVAQK